jgi:hypothetical protein
MTVAHAARHPMLILRRRARLNSSNPTIQRQTAILPYAPRTLSPGHLLQA